VPPTEARLLPRKTKHNASKTLDEWTEKQLGTPRALQVGYSKHKPQSLSETSYTHRDFFGFGPPPSLRRTLASIDKKCYNYIERDHLTRQCPLALNYHGNPTLVESSQMTIEDESTI
jgi:hypothetical protein